MFIIKQLQLNNETVRYDMKKTFIMYLVIKYMYIMLLCVAETTTHTSHNFLGRR